MNIAIFTDCYPPIKNGVAVSVSHLKQGLVKKGHNVYIITVKVPRYVDQDDDIFRVPSLPFGHGTEQRLGFVMQYRINKYIREKKIDIIHTHSEFSLGYSGKFAARKFKIPLVHTSHTKWEDYRHYLLNGRLLSTKMVRRFLKFHLKNVHALVAPSIKAKKYYRNLTPNLPSVIINNGINAQKFKSTVIDEHEILKIKKEFGLDKKDKTIIFVGRIGREKRVVELFQAILPLIQRNKHVKMLFVGDGPEINYLIKQANKQSVEREIIFTGFVNWELVYRLYSIANLFVTASMSEVHPITLIEATMCGLPLIARRDDCYLDLIKENENGYLVDTDSELAEKIESLIHDDHKLQQFSQKSLQISGNFTADNYADKIALFYEKTIEFFPDRLPELEDIFQ